MYEAAYENCCKRRWPNYCISKAETVVGVCRWTLRRLLQSLTYSLCKQLSDLCFVSDRMPDSRVVQNDGLQSDPAPLWWPTFSFLSKPSPESFGCLEMVHCSPRLPHLYPKFSYLVPLSTSPSYLFPHCPARGHLPSSFTSGFALILWN